MGSLQCDVVLSDDGNGDARVPAENWVDVVDEYGTPACKFSEDEFKFIRELQKENKLVLKLEEFFEYVHWHQRLLDDNDKRILTGRGVIFYNNEVCPQPEHYATFDDMLIYMRKKPGNVYRLLQCNEEHVCLKALRETFTYKYVRDLYHGKPAELKSMILVHSESLDKDEKDEYENRELENDKKLIMLIVSTLIRLECVLLKDLASRGQPARLSPAVRLTTNATMTPSTAKQKVLQVIQNKDSWKDSIVENYGLVKKYLTDPAVKISDTKYEENIDATIDFVLFTIRS